MKTSKCLRERQRLRNLEDLVDKSKDLSGLVGFIKRVMFETQALEI